MAPTATSAPARRTRASCIFPARESITGASMPEVAEKELLRLDFPMIRDRATLEKCYDTAARAVTAFISTLAPGRSRASSIPG